MGWDGGSGRMRQGGCESCGASEGARIGEFSFPAQTQIYLAVEAADMRKQVNGIWAEAPQRLREDPFGGALSVFSNHSRELSPFEWVCHIAFLGHHPM